VFISQNGKQHKSDIISALLVPYVLSPMHSIKFIHWLCRSLPFTGLPIAPPECRHTFTSGIVAAWPRTKELHWLPVVYRIQFKLALVMFTIHTHRCPDYLTDSAQACNSDPARTRLRSASSSSYTVPRTRTRLGDRAFCGRPSCMKQYQQQFVKLTACICLGAS